MIPVVFLAYSLGTVFICAIGVRVMVLNEETSQTLQLLQSNSK